jgi:hypothetical protein
MPKVRIIGEKKNGGYVAHEVHPLRAAKVIEKLEKDPQVTAIKSRLILPHTMQGAPYEK